MKVHETQALCHCQNVWPQLWVTESFVTIKTVCHEKTQTISSSRLSVHLKHVIPVKWSSFTGNRHSGFSAGESLFFDPSGHQKTGYRQICLSPQWTLLESLKRAKGKLAQDLELLPLFTPENKQVFDNSNSKVAVVHQNPPICSQLQKAHKYVISKCIRGFWILTKSRHAFSFSVLSELFVCLFFINVSDKLKMKDMCFCLGAIAT